MAGESAGAQKAGRTKSRRGTRRRRRNKSNGRGHTPTVGIPSPPRWPGLGRTAGGSFGGASPLRASIPGRGGRRSSVHSLGFLHAAVDVAKAGYGLRDLISVFDVLFVVPIQNARRCGACGFARSTRAGLGKGPTCPWWVQATLSTHGLILFAATVV